MSRDRRTPPPSTDCTEQGCHNPGHYLCTYPLRGRSAGKTCGRPVCSDHYFSIMDTGPQCGSHGRLTTQGAKRG